MSDKKFGVGQFICTFNHYAFNKKDFEFVISKNKRFDTHSIEIIEEIVEETHFGAWSLDKQGEIAISCAEDITFTIL